MVTLDWLKYFLTSPSELVQSSLENELRHRYLSCGHISKCLAPNIKGTELYLNYSEMTSCLATKHDHISLTFVVHGPTALLRKPNVYTRLIYLQQHYLQHIWLHIRSLV